MLGNPKFVRDSYMNTQEVIEHFRNSFVKQGLINIKKSKTEKEVECIEANSLMWIALERLEHKSAMYHVFPRLCSLKTTENC